MNEDILKGKLQEIKGKAKETWGKLIYNNLVEIEGKSEKLLGLLRKEYGYIRDKTAPEYKDYVEMVEIVSNIRKIMTHNKDFLPFAYIARYWQPLLAKKQESQIKETEEKHGDDTDRYFDTRLSRRTAHLASQ